MPNRTFEWISRIKAVEAEHTAARLAADRLLAAAEHDPTILGSVLKVRDIRQMSERLDGTYIIRLFAEFETGLRLFWPKKKAGADPPSRTRDLLEGIAATCRIPHDERVRAHDVREYRNMLVHERDEPVAPIPIANARGHLCRYFKFLPPEW